MVVFMVVFEAVLAASAIRLAASAHRQRSDRRRSTTLEHFGGAALIAALAAALPANLATARLTTLRSALDAVLLVVMLAVGTLMAARKPLEWWEESSATQLLRAAGVPAPPSLVPPWAVVIADGLLTAVSVVVAVLAVSWLSTGAHWTNNQLLGVAIASVVGVVVVGTLLTAGHWWWQRGRVRRAAAARQAGNDTFLG